MERELLLELGLEEIPASWLPGLTNQIGEVLAAQLSERRLGPETAVETYSTPRRLTVRIERIPERQADFEELINGPAASAPAQAIAGFAAKQGIDPSVLEKIETPKGVYLAYRKRVRGKTAVDVLPEVLGGLLRALTFPKMMRWDAMIEDGKGELLFGRPIRWILYTYGGRVVPFTISRTPAAQTSQVQDVSTGAATYGHRFLTTSGRAGRAIKVRSFEEYRNRLIENFVIIERSERHNRIASQLDAKAQRLQGRVSRVVRQDSGLLNEVPDLVEYPSVIAGTFSREFLELPDEVLTTTLIHHQHYFPVEGEDGKLKEAFLAVINTEPDNERTIARNAERVVTARLRDARFFWEADRKSTLESKVERLSTLVFHKKLGTYKEKSERIETLARWIAKEGFGASDVVASHAALAARWSKADLATDMVREFPELQGIMGGVYARVEGQPEDVWKAIYHHYLPLGVEADAPPTKAMLGSAAVTWAAVSLADKFDTLVGLFSAGEKPTGSRDPFALRRAAQAAMKVLTDTPSNKAVTDIVEQAILGYGQAHQVVNAEWRSALSDFLIERQAHLFERRGFKADEARAVAPHWRQPHLALRRIEAVAASRTSPDFVALAGLLKRVQNITKDFETTAAMKDLMPKLKEPAELALAQEVERRWPAIDQAIGEGRYADAMRELAHLRQPVDQFFKDVMVMVDDAELKNARLTMLTTLRKGIRDNIADIAEIASDETRSA